ncbi:hypothetical protein AVU38_gp204 [Ralstonia phage RSL2]|nr:hypothetical protein AVU38_gp204 [Ralstonia phage RSL2]
MNNAISLQVAIINALFNEGQEISCTLAAIKHKVARQAVVATEEEILETLTGLMNQGKIELTKNVSDNDAWMLLQDTRNELLEKSMDKQELAAPPAEIKIEEDTISRRVNIDLDVLNVVVKTITEEDVVASMRNNRDQGREKITSLNNLFAVGLQQANYEFDMAAVEGEDIGTGMGYYDPLAAAVFLDEQGQKVTAGKTVRFLDEKTHRRLYIVVLQPGMNVIIHDRFSFTENGFGGTLVCTTDATGARDYIGMEPAWSEGCMYDFVMACRLFGFEYDRSKNEVYMPRERKQNLFVSNIEFQLNASHRFMKKQRMALEA